MEVEFPEPSAELTYEQRKLSTVNSYLRNQLPHDLHPSYSGISQQIVQKSRPALPSSSHTAPTPASQSLITDQDNDSCEAVATDEIYKEANNESLRFQCLLQDYEKTSAIKYKTGINLNDLHNWEQVLAEVDHAASAYKNKSSLWSKVRRMMKKFGENHHAFDAWLNLLPTQSQYCSLLCGGLKLIINAAARFNEVRESVFEALAEIPLHLNNTKLILEVFKKSGELHRSSSELYLSTLGTLQHIVVWFQERATKKVSKALLRQKVYERELTEKLKAVGLASKRFYHVAKTCSWQKQDEMQNTLRQTKSEVQVNQLAIQRFQDDASQGFRVLGETIRAGHEELRQNFDSRLTSVKDQLLAGILGMFLKSNERIDLRTGSLKAHLSPDHGDSIRIARNEKQRQQVERALNALRYDSSVPLIDIDSLLRVAWNFTKAGQDRAVAPMQDRRLHAWIKGSVSAILMVNGNFNPSASRSPLSFVCAKLVDSIRPASSSPEVEARTSCITAHSFFCGQHLPSKRLETSSIAGLVGSLITQILTDPCTEFDLSTTDEILRINVSDVDALCTIYSALVMKIPAQMTIFCVIDALTFHEDNKARCRDAVRLVQTLADLAESCVGDGHCVFKVLLTCPGVSRALYKELAKADVIWMPKNVIARGGFTSMKWSASAGRDLSNLGRQESY